MATDMELGPLPPPTCGAAVVPGNAHMPPRAVWTAYSAEDMRAYAAEQVAPLLAKIAELQATLELQQRSYEREIALDVAAERERIAGTWHASHGYDRMGVAKWIRGA